MSLTDDLGFDSLMVGDLATGIADAFPGLGGIPQELFINNPSVQDLVDYINTGGDGSHTSEANDHEPLKTYSLGWAPAPFPSWDSQDYSGQKVLILGDENPISLGLRKGLTEAGAILVEPGSEGPVDTLIWLSSWLAPSPIHGVIAGERPMPDRSGEFIAALATQARNQPQVFVVRRSDDHWSGGVGAAVRCLSREWDGAVGKDISLDVNLHGPLASERLLAEIASMDQSACVRHSREQRFVRSLIPSEPGETYTPSSDDTILITGGTRGIGAQLATRLADSGASLLLVGRSEPQAAIKDLIAQHTRVHFVQADVTDREGFIKAVQQSLEPNQSVSVLIHCAGLLADGPLESVDPEKGLLARKVKVDGWLNALAACGTKLRVAMGLGSWAGRFGSRHQVHYASANGQMAALAQAGWGDCRCIVAEFGPWSSSEMAATIPAPVKAAMRAEGVDFVGDEAGLDAIVRMLGSARGIAVQGRRLPATLRRIVRTESLSTETHPYLLDHALEGIPVLPLAAAADAIATTASIPAPFELSDLTLYQGVAVTEPTTITTVVDNGRGEIRVGPKKALAYRAKVQPWTGEYSDPGQVQGGQPPAMSLESFYGEITFHGPQLQGIQSLDAESEDFIRGKIRTSNPTQWIPASDRTAWAIDPLALDSVMQMSGYLAYNRFQRAGTPVGIARYIQFRPFPSGSVTGEVRIGVSGGDRFSGDLYLRGDGGELLAVAEGAVAEMRQVGETQEDAFEIKEEWVNPSSWAEVKDLKMRIEAVGLMGLRNPYFAVHDGTARDITSIEGREHINFSSYNYIGLSGDPRVIQDVHQAVEQFGTSVSASRVASGERPFHGELEALLAACQGCEDALVFTAGHATNVTTIGHLFGPDDLIMHDELIHDSILQGIKLSGAARRGFRHDEPAHLEQQLAELRRHHQRVLIVVEGVYSMDGDVCSLPQYVAIKKKHGAMLMVDEAHSFGVIGETGKGAAEHYGLKGSEVDLWMGTLSKSLASCGGWIAGSKDLITYLRYTAPGFVYSAGITPANAQAALSALKLMLKESERVTTLQDNAKFFHDCLKERGLDTGPAKGASGVIPVITGNSMHALVLSQRLGDAGINVQPIMFPAVADDAARLRFFLSSTHSYEQLKWTAERVAEILEQVREEFKLA
jgi:8-amino-7-oxononanoate synthase